MITGRAAIRGRSREAAPPSATVLRQVQLSGVNFTAVTGRGNEIIASSIDGLRRFDGTTGALISGTSSVPSFNEIALMPDGAHIAGTIQYLDRIRTYDATTLVYDAEVSIPAPFAIAFADGDTLVSEHKTSRVRVLDGFTSTVKQTISFTWTIDAMEWTGRHLVAANKNTVRVFDGLNPTVLRTFTVSDLYGLGWDGSNLMSITSTGLVSFHANEAL